MPYIEQLELPSGSIYDLHDSRVDSINNWQYVVCTDATNTPKDVTWKSGSTTITGTLVAAATTMYKIYLVPSVNGTNDIYDEYVTVNNSGTSYIWELFGNTSLPDMTQYVKNKSGHSGGTAGNLAYKDTASGSVEVPSTYTSTTSVSTATTESKTVSVTGTTKGSVSVTSSAVEITPSATGTAANKYTPAGSNTSSDVTGSCSVTPSGSISVGTGTANYTPEGSISVSSAGSTTTIKNPTSKTVVTDMSVSDPSATTATGELVYCSVSGTKLILKKFVETTGASISTSDVTVKDGDASYSFSGTGKELKFTGSASSGTISGTAAAQTFQGTDTYFKTASNVATGASFVGDSMTSEGSVDVPKTYSATTTTTTDTTDTKTVTVS